jgi:ABC-type uncharacterized transport system permease subunit
MARVESEGVWACVRECGVRVSGSDALGGDMRRRGFVSVGRVGILEDFSSLSSRPILRGTVFG